MNEQQEKFVAEFIRNGNNAQAAARTAGFPENSCRQRGWELTHKNKEVMEAIANANAVHNKGLSDATLTPDAIFEANITQAIETLAQQTKDPAGAKVFYETFLKHNREKQEVLGEYANLSTAELIARIDDNIKELTSLKERALEEIRAREMQDRPNVSSKGSTGI